MREITVKHGRLTWRRWYGTKMRLHSAFEQQKGSGHVFFFGFGAIAAYGPKTRKKRVGSISWKHGTEGLHGKNIWSVPTFLWARTHCFLWCKCGASVLIFLWLRPWIKTYYLSDANFQRINRLYCEYGQCKFLKGFVRLLMWRWLTVKKKRKTHSFHQTDQIILIEGGSGIMNHSYKTCMNHESLF